MTPEEQVKAKWPDAIFVRCKVCGGAHIYNGSPHYSGFRMIGNAQREHEAWSDAASHLKEPQQ